MTNYVTNCMMSSMTDSATNFVTYYMTHCVMGSMTDSVTNPVTNYVTHCVTESGPYLNKNKKEKAAAKEQLFRKG